MPKDTLEMLLSLTCENGYRDPCYMVADEVQQRAQDNFDFSFNSLTVHTALKQMNWRDYR